jgi:hypothetical protein
MVRTRLASLALASSLGLISGCLGLSDHFGWWHCCPTAWNRGCCCPSSNGGCCAPVAEGCCEGGGFEAGYGVVPEGPVLNGSPFINVPPPPPPGPPMPVPAVPPRLVPMPQSTPVPYVPQVQ